MVPQPCPVAARRAGHPPAGLIRLVALAGLLLSACSAATEEALEPMEGELTAEEVYATLEAVPTADPLRFVGSFSMISTGASSEIQRTLILNASGQATLSTLYVDRSPVPIVETGTWNSEGTEARPVATVILDAEDGEAKQEPDAITLEIDPQGALVATVYNLELYGREGLRFLPLE